MIQPEGRYFDEYGYATHSKRPIGDWSTRMTICVLGPVYPYRGGISHYTTLMSKALSKRHQVINVSYSLQYPKLLFRRGEQKDFSNPSMELPNVRFQLNTINPVSWLRVARNIDRIKPDLLIIPWWHPYFTIVYWSICKLLSENIPILFLCHNVLPHEPFPLQRELTKLVLKRGDMFLVHSAQEERQIRELFPDGKYKIGKNKHPTYEFFKSGGITQGDARQRLGLAEKKLVLLFFGFVREYKGLKVLLTAYPEIYSQTNCALLIVGEFAKSEKAEYDRLIREAAGASNSITVVDRYVPDPEVENYFAACDLVVAPYLSATQSGVVTTAYGFEKPVVATRVGGLPEAVYDGETGYIISTNDPKALADAVERFAKEPDKERFARAIRQKSYQFSWEHLVDTIEELSGQRK